MSVAEVSKAEVDFALQALQNEAVRLDGRTLTACRKVGIRFGLTHGEVEVTFGPTRAFAVCTGEIIVPPPDRANEGRLQFHVEFSPLASPQFEPGRPSPKATTVANFIERLIRGSRAVDSEALCIVGGQKVWSIRVDVRALDDDGNLCDACAIAALCSLLHFRKTEVEVREGEAKSYNAEDRIPVPLSIHHLPVPVSFGLFTHTEKGRKGETAWILDPNRIEEAATDGALCIAVNQHGELCGVHKPGGMPVDFETIQLCTDLAVRRAKELTAKIKMDVEEDLMQRSAQRRNVHEKFSASDLLTVDVPGAKSTAISPGKLAAQAKLEAELEALAKEAASIAEELGETGVEDTAASDTQQSQRAVKKGRKKKRRVA